MQKNLTLVIMAAGMGSRFGGLKQIEPVGPNGEFIIDYSVYDAIEVGFNKVVFVIKEENYEIFKNTVGARFESIIDIEYVFQKTEDIPDSKFAEKRIKPWGTAHAIRSVRDVVKENFMVINADDFYGRKAFVVGYNFLVNSLDEFLIVGYKVKNTLSENGAARRGILETKNGYLTSIIESSIERKGEIIYASPLVDETDVSQVEENSLISMNMIGFTPKVFEYLENDIINFFEQNKNNASECEFLIPDVIMDHTNTTNVRIIETDSIWYGITYKEDLDQIKNAINDYHNNGEYPKTLWN